ncbi:hypothetical protein NC652_041645 [Populus alba x Populus x berolinensis]|uniref:Uncharacterized protein n=1 Tax=Populus alba x Populus x berolinensis TaxID=444605 RepID=A0AAD6L9H5_9ROSI|nr:hypothetical protein NC651_040512 [Populus alba x Populus x berolinensis]KAJ6859421.1 hypothetical protein NC652_041645 [Populus alba x Populus x berolinensis]KAJ6952806.1 hypothetical protein NC653_041824 [Populus alba x Populus x berolinensis]
MVLIQSWQNPIVFNHKRSRRAPFIFGLVAAWQAGKSNLIF